ncbi:MAG: TerB family tellurite resistance protein [Gammaproteobacteria bacterium]|nr:TerB family tellurite resistance protein [Gammaproteobacteria bacterium]MDH3371550.1 TerB family tellurite resistance protein [Gammaproteobacteria bacterium]MDH3405587.1 TerB family tellurite resistance protein [Gammaproteobacteria bacterium]MDH3563022.1 TerB family tellurite resistance protein [Gammaproteobacteria bacterium]MDH5486584.1 TerB family tellurite resistance protein [Gammaproteobacteria bacterium]
MLQNLKQFFDRNILAGGQNQGQEAEHALQVATAALLFEVMRMNGELKDVERHAMTAAIRERFDLTAEEMTTLLRLAEEEAEEATDYYQFTALINRHYTPAQKEQVVEHMWQVAAADREIDRFERTLVHKVADLLHVPRPAQFAARERAFRAARQSAK